MNDLGVLVGGLKRNWWVVLLVAAFAAGSAYLVSQNEDPVYRAFATLVVTPNYKVKDTTDFLRSLETLERRTIVSTFSKIPSRQETREEAARQLGLDTAVLQGYRIRGSVVPNTNIVRIEVQGHDPKRVVEVASAATAITRTEARKMYRIYSLRVMADPRTPNHPIHPNPRRSVIVASVAGLFVGMLAAMALETVQARSKPAS